MLNVLDHCNAINHIGSYFNSNLGTNYRIEYYLTISVSSKLILMFRVMKYVEINCTFSMRNLFT